MPFIWPLGVIHGPVQTVAPQGAPGWHKPGMLEPPVPVSDVPAAPPAAPPVPAVPGPPEAPPVPPPLVPAVEPPRPPPASFPPLLEPQATARRIKSRQARLIRP